MKKRELYISPSEGLFSNLQPHGFTISGQKVNPFQHSMKQTQLDAFPFLIPKLQLNVTFGIENTSRCCNEFYQALFYTW